MKVFVLGGYGKTGIAAIKLLAQSEMVTKIAVAGRNLARAEKAAAETGEKAVAVEADGVDEKSLLVLTAGYDIIINAADDDAVLPCIQAAMHNGSHYCDMAWAQILEDALLLAPQAKAAGITAIIATGISPCITNLMGVHAARQLDSVEQFQTGRGEIIDFKKGRELSPRQWLDDPKQSFAVLSEYKPFLAWTLQRLQENGSVNMQVYHDLQWGEINPIQYGVEAPLMHGEKTTAFPYFSGGDFFGTLPRDIAKKPPVEMGFSPLPPQLDALLREKALHILEGNSDSETALVSFYETIESDPHHWLTVQEDFTPIAKVWVRALGHKDGRAAQHTCWFSAPMWEVNGYFLTSVALAAAVFKIMRGETQVKGVMLAEKAFEPQSFFNEVAALLPEPLPNDKLIEESFKWL